MNNIYLIKCDSYRLLDYILSDIIKDNKNVTINSLNEMSIYDCIDDASYFGLFDEERIIIIKDVKYFGGRFNYEEEANAIKNFISHNLENTTLIFICDNILKSKDLTKTLISSGATIIDKSIIEENDIEEIKNKYTEETGIKIDKESFDLLMKNANNNIDIVFNEIDKLSNISETITKELVLEYGSIVGADETFEFIDAVVQKRFNVVFELLDKLVNKNTEILGLISLLANRFSTIYIVKSADIDNLSDEKIAEILGYKNKGRLYYVRKDGKIYTLDQVKEIIINLSELDKKIKTGYNPIYGIKELLLNL